MGRISKVKPNQATVMVKNAHYEEYFFNRKDALEFINKYCKNVCTQIYKKVGSKWILAGYEAKITWQTAL